MLSSFLLRLDQLGVLSGRIGLHGLDLHFFAGDLRAQAGRGLDQRLCLAVQLDQAGRLLRLLQRHFRIGQIVFGLFQLLLKRN